MKNLVLFLSCCIFTLSANAQQWRLQKIIYSNEGITNSIRTFFYSGTRGSDFKNGIINYDTSYAYDGKWEPNMRYIQLYDTAERQISYNSKTIGQNAVWFYRSFSKGTMYSPSGKISAITEYVEQYKSIPQTMTYLYKYDSSDLLIEIYDTNFVFAGDPGFANRRLFSYDSLQNLVSVLFQYKDTLPGQYANHKKNLYYYDSNSILMSIEELTATQIPDSFIQKSKTVYTYDTSHKLIETEYYKWLNNVWQPNSKKLYIYTTRVKASRVEMHNYDISTSSYELKAFTNYNYNADNDTTSVLEYTWNDNKKSIQPHSLKEIIYNQYKQPDTIKHSIYRLYNNLPDTSFSTEQHIYEIHWPANITVPIEQLTIIAVYPNPTSEVLTIRADIAAGKDFYVALYNMEGRIIKQWLEKNASANYIKSIQVSELPPGNYIIKLSGQGIQGSARFSIVK